MNKMKLKLCVLLLSGLGLTGLQAQVSNPASGGNASGSGGSVSYSVGQVVCSAGTGTNGSVEQGVQPFIVSIITGMDQKDIDLSYSVYPNPATDYLNLKLVNFQSSTYNYQLFDINGKMIGSEAIIANETSISMTAFAGGTYFLKIVETKASSTKEVKSFKIIKK